MPWEDIFRDLFGTTQTPNLPGATDAGMPMGQPTVPVIQTAALPPAQPTVAAQPGVAPSMPAAAPPTMPTAGAPAAAPEGPIGQPRGPTQGTPPQGPTPGQQDPMRMGKPTLSPEMMRALTMMMSSGDQQRMPSAPGVARPAVAPFLQTQPGAVMPAGRGFGTRRGF